MIAGRESIVNIEGIVSEVVYMNPETGFAVIEVDTGEELLPAVGELYGVAEGEELRLTGSYTLSFIISTATVVIFFVGISVLQRITKNAGVEDETIGVEEAELEAVEAE